MTSKDEEQVPLWLHRVWLIISLPVVIILLITVALLFAILGALKALIEEMPGLIKDAVQKYRDSWDGDYE